MVGPATASAVAAAAVAAGTASSEVVKVIRLERGQDLLPWVSSRSFARQLDLMKLPNSKNFSHPMYAEPCLP